MMRLRGNDNGFVLVTALVILLILVVIGIAATTTSTIELQIAGNDKVNTISFYTAESARSWVQVTPSLYGAANTVAVAPLSFPSASNPAATQTLADGQTFNGQVAYNRAENPPPGSKYAAGQFKAHYYRMQCTGFGPNNAESRVGAEFYRIGF